jgi:hypothetical protein
MSNEMQKLIDENRITKEVKQRDTYVGLYKTVNLDLVVTA